MSLPLITVLADVQNAPGSSMCAPLSTSCSVHHPSSNCVNVSSFVRYDGNLHKMSVPLGCVLCKSICTGEWSDIARSPMSAVNSLLLVLFERNR
ncbi:hypothetical protein GDO81_015826 [Engystomops pustulosus]|uniref:Secreted protein n=1 Tax=Engystomops pustulosus TaxID=76066 RepID=A0AAV7ATF1_ENGPU|nr:hypothetical protein GDO81_015826 [Engystomops pustulosus]